MRDPGTILVAVAHPLERAALVEACESYDLAVAAAGASGAWALDAVQATRSSLVLAAAWLEDGPVDGVLPRLARHAAVVVLVDDPGTDRAIALLDGGASGCVSYDSSFDGMVASVSAVRRGGVAVPGPVLQVVFQEWRRLRRQEALASAVRGPIDLTPREQDVMVAMADGLATKAIARRLGVATKTVENHKIRVFEKLGVRNQAQAVAEAMARGLVGGLFGAAPRPPRGIFPLPEPVES